MIDRRSDNPIIYASEIGQYHYCQVSWYLQKCGYKPNSPYLKKGESKHHSLGRILISVEKQNSRSKILSYLGIFCLLFSLIFFIVEVIL